MSGLKFITISVAAVALMLATAVSPCAAQGRLAERMQARRAARQARLQGNHAGQWLRRYKDLPPDQQQKALENDPQFRSLPPARQQILRERLQRFSSLPPQQQDRILQRMETWEHLTPAQKQQARQLYSQLKELPPERRQKLRTAIRDLSAMPPAQRQQVIDSDRFKSEFSPQERGLLSSASQLPLAPAENTSERTRAGRLKMQARASTLVRQRHGRARAWTLAPTLLCSHGRVGFDFLEHGFRPQQGFLNVGANVLAADHVFEFCLMNHPGGLLAGAAQ